jgi:putative colanic acid biosynthesis acetyltransferase WcaF
LITIGENVAISHGVVFYNLGGATVGHRAVISQDVYLCGGTHDYTKSNYPLVRKPIIIEDDVWIGAGAFIGPGVRIGQGAVVGARAVVFKDIPPWKVAVGNPARVIKDRVLI